MVFSEFSKIHPVADTSFLCISWALAIGWPNGDKTIVSGRMILLGSYVISWMQCIKVGDETRVNALRYGMHV